MSRAIIVVGMHRSGTSCLAGILQGAGVDFGEVSTSNAFNPHGNRENREVMRLHDDILRANGGSWDDPPAVVYWSDSQRSRGKSIADRSAGSEYWGFKDPRALLVLGGWLDILENAAIVGTFRHPMRVARSLRARNGFSFEKGLSLWQTYNQKLLDAHDHEPFPVVSFDLPADEYLRGVGAVLAALNLSVGEQALRFFDDELRHAEDQDAFLKKIPPRVAWMYERLRRIAI